MQKANKFRYLGEIYNRKKQEQGAKKREGEKFKNSLPCDQSSVPRINECKDQALQGKGEERDSVCGQDDNIRKTLGRTTGERENINS